MRVISRSIHWNCHGFESRRCFRRNDLEVTGSFNICLSLLSKTCRSSPAKPLLRFDEENVKFTVSEDALRVHTCALIGLFIPKQGWLPFEGFVEAEKCFRQCLRPKRWTEFRSDCSENCDCTVGRQRFEDSDIWDGNRWEYYKSLRYFCCSCYLVLLKICFFNSRFVKEYLQSFSLSINLAVRLQRFSIVLPLVFFDQ